ncbi:hypothetical protein Patl1_30746 [Pistacia atlantica]|uniref:Uncharacterized protein n=1 Tax=Pistacia atlantica TaxID=434234 RepID=A0ACC1AC09_9ROSI|nr:hypothetical protein Patl1_30746 [Pistacia atlantica]
MSGVQIPPRPQPAKKGVYKLLLPWKSSGSSSLQ